VILQRLALAAIILTSPAAVADPAPEARMLAPGIISTPGNEFSGAMTPDGANIYFSRSVPRSYMYAIFVSHKDRKGVWSRPQLAPFSGHGRDFDPVISPDGRHMVFISDRPTAKGKQKHDYDVWKMERTPSGAWSEPQHPGLPVNTEKAADDRSFNNNEWFASITNDGTLYVASDGYEPGGKMQIYRLRFVDGRYQTPENLGPTINGEGYANGEPIVSPDGSFLLFASFGRKGGLGNWDIYISPRLPDGSWGAAENLGPAVNTSARDYSPRLEPDGHTLIFTSERNFTTSRTTPVSWPELKAGALGLLNGNGNLYEIDLCALNLKSLSCPNQPAR
jgi:Tol biopolymer transport system component